MPSNPIISPAPFVASYAVAFADQNGAAHNVSQASPLPVNLSSTSNLPVTVSNTQPLAVSGSVTVANSSSSPLSVSVSNSQPLPVSGSVTVANSSAAPLAVSLACSREYAANRANRADRNGQQLDCGGAIHPCGGASRNARAGRNMGGIG